MELPPPPPPQGSDANLRKHLSSNGWPTGLQNALIGGTVSTPVRFMICDDSGSMMSSDGHRVAGEGTNTKYGSVTTTIAEITFVTSS